MDETEPRKDAHVLRILVILVSMILLTACTDDSANVPTSAQEAVLFGGLTLPPGVEVLGVSAESGMDTLYELSLRATVAQRDELLRRSNFTTPVLPTRYHSDRDVIAGPPLSTATDLRYAQDTIDTEHGRVVREVLEDRRSIDDVYVHLAMFTT
jgi:hypothetical protein